MTFSAQDQQRLENIRARFHTLQEYLGDLPEKERLALGNALSTLSDSLEELEVAEEELRQQNEDLYKAQQQLEAERKRYRDLFEFAPDGYLVTTALGVILEANRAAARLYEMEDGSLLGRWIWQFFADEMVRGEVQHALEKAPRTTTPLARRAKMRTRSDRRFEADVHVTPTHDVSGDLTELRWLVRDVTERAMADERLRASEQQLAEAQQIAHVGSWDWDIPTNVITWSEEMLRIYGPGQTGGMLSFQDFLARVHPNDRERVNRIIGEALRTRQPFTFEHRAVRPDGTVRTLLARGRIIVDGKGTPLRMVGTGQDVTDYRQASEQIQLLNERLEQRVVERTAQLEEANDGLRREIGERKQTEAALRESEQQFRQLAESIDQVFWLGESNSLRPLYLSPVFERVFGLPRQALYDNPAQFFNAIHPEDRERVMQGLTRQPDGNFSDEFRILRPDGNLRWIWMRTFPAWGRDGGDEGRNTRRFVGLMQDITSRQQTEDALRSALERAQELYQISRLIASVRTPDDVLHALILSNYLRRINRAAILLFDQPWLDHAPENLYALASWRGGADLPSIEGQTFPLSDYGFTRLFVPDQPVYVHDIDTDARVNAKTREWYHRLKTRSVLLFPLVASGQWYGMLSLHSETPSLVSQEDMRHMRGLADQAAVAIHNIRLLQAEAKARREAEVANDLKMKFLAMISHELRTPLTSIKGFATTLLAKDVTWDEESQRDFLTTINQEADKLTDMIDQLLDLSRLQAGTLRIKAAPVSFGDILDTAMAQMQTLAQNHPLSVDVPADLPPLNADRQRIAQVLANLVSNAAKYSPQHTAISLTAREEGAFVRIAVRDEGPGISPDERTGVFLAFQRGESAHRSTKGAGLGLAICKALIEAHGGSIWVEDHEGPGTLMVFKVPKTLTTNHQSLINPR